MIKGKYGKTAPTASWSAKPQSQYHEQVRQYVELLQSMGFENVQGYLWFVYDNTIEAVRQQ